MIYSLEHLIWANRFVHQKSKPTYSKGENCSQTRDSNESLSQTHQEVAWKSGSKCFG